MLPLHRRSFALTFAIVVGLCAPAFAASSTPQLVANFLREFRDPWVLFGFSAQFVFMMRFVVQWIASERRGRSYVPLGFWYLSLLGGLMLFAYALRKQDPVFMFGQLLGCLIYIRNLWMIHARGRSMRLAQQARAVRFTSLADRVMNSDGMEPDATAPAADTVVTGDGSRRTPASSA